MTAISEREFLGESRIVKDSRSLPRLVDAAARELRHFKEWKFPTGVEVSDIGHKALCPMSLVRTRAYYRRVPGILWARAGYTIRVKGIL